MTAEGTDLIAFPEIPQAFDSLLQRDVAQGGRRFAAVAPADAAGDMPDDLLSHAVSSRED